ncbi:major facilitator transporter [Amycolatopsis mediterranei S699]|uniref:Major facilitator transporter n=4 Tax=Amycolatopsis mediterranei TaxID=33910 RepID=A0A0H3DDS6_AMYMU|nr:major facilitator transporter [Amycolatopsis mediterranei U32]AEK45792.1 major facilitator transporter [Amycolatopsis mediterranei S699]AFO80554.1 major facilitator transporter [Amycolatopsis mediterranei S699]AGT87682.1 major facilitator transporter [Amycolatopsis mediterranei RB]KDU94039.1 MFS transporter [Amycolatopsis mediterranei]
MMSSSAELSDSIRPTRPVPIIIAILLLAVVVSTFESTMMFNALPRLISAFHTSPANVSWVLTAYTLVAAASAAVCGRLGDVYGRRRVLLVLLLVSAVGSIISISTGDLAGVVTGRAIQGISGGILPLCFGIVREHLPRHRIPVAVAVIAGAAMLAGAAGNIISGAIIDALDWHYIFVVAAAVALIAAGACTVLPRSRLTATVTRIDWIGAILFAPAIGLVLFGITESGSWGWADGRTLGFIVGGLALLAVWIWWELRRHQPMINLRLFGERKQALTLTATAFASIGPIGATGFLLQLIMQTPTSAPIGLGLTATAAGALSFCTAIIGFLLSPLSGRISRLAGSRRSLAIGGGFGILSTILLAVIGNSLVGMLITALCLTVTTSFMLTSLPNLIVEGVPAENTSEATGVNTVVQQAFNGVGNSVATLLLSLSLVPGTEFSTKGAYLQVFGLIGVCCVAALVLSLFIRKGSPAVSGAPAAPVVAEA